MQTRHLSIPVFLLALASCGGPPKTEWTITAKSVEKKAGNSTLKLEYPVIEGASAELNNQLAGSALTHLEQVEDDPIPFDEYARNFAEDSAGGQWANESILTVVFRSQTALTTVCKTYTNTGGAHPNTFVHYETWDPRTGRRLDYTDLLEPGKADALRTLAGVKEGDYPNEPDVGLLADHLVYVPDPDSRTASEIRIPYARLKGILKPQFLPGS